MSITYNQVEEFTSKHKRSIDDQLRELKEELPKSAGIDSEKIYIIKTRAKHPDSVFLKTKRKNKTSLSDITDYGGVRILCLFEQDLFDIHTVLLKYLEREHYILEEFLLYNWTDPHDVEDLTEVVSNSFPEYSYKQEPTDTGYKSIHFVVYREKDDYKIEIQLRTLLQDVWAELHHNVAYKHGNVHPHILECFRILSRDLENNDLLLKHLRDVNDKEYVIDHTSLKNAGPEFVFKHQSSILPKMYQKSDYKNYINFLHLRREPDISKQEWANQGMELLQNVESRIQSSSEKGQYWRQAERAYWRFYEGKLERAMNDYDALLNAESTNLVKERYSLHFRKGQLYFIDNKITEALVEFDTCEALLGEENGLVAYRLKSKLAHIYWQLGEEYYDIAYKKILNAESIVNSTPEMFPNEIKRSLVNNKCWYCLEVYLLTKKKSINPTTKKIPKKKAPLINELFRKVKLDFKELEEYLALDDVHSNELDTAAWCFYQFYLKSNRSEDIDKAEEYIKLAIGKENNATHQMISTNMQRAHLQEIIQAKLRNEKKGRI